VRRQSRGVTPG